MVTITRALARQFRAVLRRLVSPTGPRGPCPFVLVHADSDGLTMQARLEEAALRYHQPGPHEPDAIAFKADALTGFEGKGAVPVILEQLSFGKGRARWEEAGTTRESLLDTVVAQDHLAFPELPEKLVDPGPDFLPALGEAVQTAAGDAARYALTRVQLRGAKGELVATDGRQLLVQGGFHFPWQEDVLIPALPAFTGKVFPSGESVGVGRTEAHVALAIGPWTVALAIDKAGRFPPYENVIPQRGRKSARLRIDPQDAALLLSALPRMPGKEEHMAPITLELGPTICMRAQGEQEEHIAEVVLPRSQSQGPSLRVVINRRYLLRAIKMGFAEVTVNSPEQPLLCRDATRIFLWMPLDAQSALPPASEALRPASVEEPPTPPTENVPLNPERERSDSMPAPNGNGPPRNGEEAMPTTPGTPPMPWGIDEIIAEAESVRAALAETHARVGRLVAALKRQRRQSRALESMIESLRHMQPPVR